jgi:hypothetical protein
MGGAGTGKSVVSAKFLDIADTAKKTQYRIGAVHFCLHTNAKDSHPVRLVTSIAAQLSDSLPGLHDGITIDNNLLSKDVETLFKVLISEPLAIIASKQSDKLPVVILIDALDELPIDGMKSIMQLLAKEFLDLPDFIRIIVTSREDAVVKNYLSKNHKPNEIRVDELRNKQDICSYLATVASEVIISFFCYLII